MATSIDAPRPHDEEWQTKLLDEAPTESGGPAAMDVTEGTPLRCRDTTKRLSRERARQAPIRCPWAEPSLEVRHWQWSREPARARPRLRGVPHSAGCRLTVQSRLRAGVDLELRRLREQERTTRPTTDAVPTPANAKPPVMAPSHRPTVDKRAARMRLVARGLLGVAAILGRPRRTSPAPDTEE